LGIVFDRHYHQVELLWRYNPTTRLALLKLLVSAFENFLSRPSDAIDAAIG
jgi:hypothetical protein